MALVHGPEPVSLQRLVLPLFAVDRTIQEFHDLIYDVQDMADDLDDMVLSSATLPLRTAVRHLHIALTELQIHKLRFHQLIWICAPRFSLFNTIRARVWHFDTCIWPTHRTVQSDESPQREKEQCAAVSVVHMSCKHLE